MIASKPSAREPAGAELGPQRLLQLGEVAGQASAVMEAVNRCAERTGVHGITPREPGEVTLGGHLSSHPARGRHRRGEQSQQGPVVVAFPALRPGRARKEGVRLF